MGLPFATNSGNNRHGACRGLSNFLATTTRPGADERRRRLANWNSKGSTEGPNNNNNRATSQTSAFSHCGKGIHGDELIRSHDTLCSPHLHHDGWLGGSPGGYRIAEIDCVNRWQSHPGREDRQTSSCWHVVPMRWRWRWGDGTAAEDATSEEVKGEGMRNEMEIFKDFLSGFVLEVSVLPFYSTPFASTFRVKFASP